MKLEYKNHKGKRRIRRIEPKGIEFGKTPHITDDKWLLVAHDPEDQMDKKFVMENIQRFCPKDTVQRLMCVTTYIKNKDEKFFLILHKKFNVWLPPGGKIENDETPGDAAIRETLEETGLQITLLGKGDTPSNIPSPYGIQLNPIKEGELDHVDFIYLAHTEQNDYQVDETEAEKGRWFALNEILNLDTFDTVKDWCRFFSKEQGEA